MSPFASLRFARVLVQFAVAMLMICTVRAEPVAGAAATLYAPFIPDASQANALLHPVNIMDGADDRGSLLELGPGLGLSPDEIARIRNVLGYVGCFLPSPSVGTGALFLTDRQVITAGHILFDPSGTPRSKCFFRNQAAEPVMVDLLTDSAHARFGGNPPKAGSNTDFAILTLVEPIAGAEPFPVEAEVPVAAGDALIVVTAHPAGMAAEVDKSVPVVQGCRVRRSPISSAATSFFRTDCDATGSSSGGMHLARVNGRLVFRGITITAGPWQDPKFRGAPYDEAAGSATTALGTDAAVLQAGQSLAADGS